MLVMCLMKLFLLCVCLVIEEIAQVLHCELSEDVLELCIRLCEEGVSPDALAHVVHNIQTYDPHSK